MLPSLAVDCAKIANTSRVRLFVYIDRAPGAFAALQKAVKAAAGQMSLFGGAGGVSEPKPPAGHATVHKTIDVRGHTRQTEHGIVVVPSHQRVIEAAPEEIPATPMHRDVNTGKGPPVRMLQVFPDGSGATGLVDHMGHTWGFNTGRFGQDKAHLVGGPSAHGNRAVNMRDSSLAQAAAAYRRAVDAHVTPELRAANTTMFDQHEAAKAAAAAPPKPAEPPPERPFWDNHFSDYNEARATAQTRANSRGIPMAIRKASKYDKPGYIVSSASSNDSDFAVAEIVRPEPLAAAADVPPPAAWPSRVPVAARAALEAAGKTPEQFRSMTPVELDKILYAKHHSTLYDTMAALREAKTPAPPAPPPPEPEDTSWMDEPAVLDPGPMTEDLDPGLVTGRTFQHPKTRQWRHVTAHGEARSVDISGGESPNERVGRRRITHRDATTAEVSAEDVRRKAARDARKAENDAALATLSETAKWG